jgi:hypothetical protein
MSYSLSCSNCGESFGKQSEFADGRKQFKFRCCNCGESLEYRDGYIESETEREQRKELLAKMNRKIKSRK